MASRSLRRLRDLLDVTFGTPSDGDVVTYDSGTDSFVLEAGGGGGGGAPTTATYITQTANASLSAEQALSSLSTGLVKVTNGTGVLSTAVAGTDYQAADADLSAIAALSTTSFGRSLLESADAAALRVTLGMTVSSGPFWCGNPDLRDPASFGSATAPGSNIAQFEGFIVTTPVVINRMVVVIGTASGNADFGIYASDGTSAAPGTKLVSTGSISCPAATYNTVTLTDTLLLPGFYYKSFAFDNGTATLWRNGANTMNQWKQLVTNPHYTKTSSFPLPSTVSSPSADTATTQWNLIPGRI